MEVTGAIDHETRCRHYSGRLDRIAIKFIAVARTFPVFNAMKNMDVAPEKYGPGKRLVKKRSYAEAVRPN